jgi:DNA-binding CsgD family transcriptional regulator
MKTDDPPLFPVDRFARRQSWKPRGTGPTGRPLCYSGCGREVLPPRRTRCSDACGRAWDLRSNAPRAPVINPSFSSDLNPMKIGTFEITRRERALWLGLCAGESTRHIASRLRISVRTVEPLRASLRKKLGIRRNDVPGLVRAAAEVGLLAELPPIIRREPTQNQLIA